MNLHDQFIQHIEARFTAFFQQPTVIHDTTPVPGGDINQCYILQTSEGKYFMKVNASIFGLDFFEKEARGLMHLADTGAIRVPRPLFDGKFHQQVYLVMEVLEKGEASADFWITFGRSIAHLHRNKADHYGLEYPNYIGRIHQTNKFHDRWADFYAQERILCNVYKARDRNLLGSTDVVMAENLCRRLPELMPDEGPSLLHGDLWAGNYICSETGGAAIFDPAIYYGHREMDLGMTLLFGGFDAAFYKGYQETFPLLPGWESRVSLCQLYPMLVHLLLFGGKYREEVVRILVQNQ